MKKALGIFLSVCMVFTMMPELLLPAKAEIVDDSYSIQSVSGADVAEMEEGEFATETTNETDVLAVETDGTDEAIVNFANGTTQSYTTLLEAINAAKGNVKNVVVLQKDVTAGADDLKIDKAMTLDLNGKTLSAHPTGNENWDFGPLYLLNNDVNEVVVIKNGTVSAEIDGGRNFEDAEVKLKGPVVLDGIKLVPLADDQAKDSGGNPLKIGAKLWTDGHPYTLRNCDFSQASIQNLWSTVTIESGTYSDLSWGSAPSPATPDDFGTVHETKDYVIKGGTFPNDTSAKDDLVIAPGYEQKDVEGDKFEVNAIPVNADRTNVPNKPEILKITVNTGSSDGSIAVKAEPGVQYTLNSPDGPWYYSEGGNINRSHTDGRPDAAFGKGPDEEGVTLNDANDIITFLKDKDGNPIQEGVTYTVYARYTDKALAEDATRSPEIVSSDAKMTTASALEIAKLFNQPEENGTDPSKKTTGDKFAASNPKVDVTVGSDGKVTIVLKNDVNGTVVIPDDLGEVTIDLKGNDIVGPAGTDTEDGKPAIQVVPSTKGGTTLTIIDTGDKTGTIKGGDAKPGTGKNGGDGIEVKDDANVTINIGPGVTVIGGNGASSDASVGGNGGAGVDGDVSKNEGTIIGGNGGDSNKQNGGNGGAGVDGNVTDKNAQTGVISGGDGGNSGVANGGQGGSGVTEDVNRNDGKINGGDGGDITGGKGNGGNGGSGVGDDVNVNTGDITGGNGGNSSSDDGGNGGNGGQGAGGDVGQNTGNITGGNGGNATSDNGGDGGNGGQGTGGNVSDNSGNITGGNGGNSTGGNGGNGGSGASGNVGGNGQNTSGANGNGTGESNPDGGNKMPAGLSPEEAEIWKNSESLESVEKSILNADTDKGDVKGSSFSRLRLRAIGKNKAIQLKWKKQSKADGYIIYGSACGSKMKKLKTIKKAATTSWTKKKLKKGKYYKYMVVAYKTIGKEKRVIAKSIGVHAVTKGGKYGNPEKVVIRSKKKLTLKKGKTAKIKATYTSKKKVRTHIRIVRFESSNKKVATVSKTGKIKAKKKGKCTIYVYAQNGIYKTVKVTVK